MVFFTICSERQLNKDEIVSVVFACFSGAALFAPDGKYLYLGGSLLSGKVYLLYTVHSKMSGIYIKKNNALELWTEADNEKLRIRFKILNLNSAKFMLLAPQGH